MPQALAPHVVTLLYPFRGDQLLLLRRRKQPNLGLWSPPGGKVEPGETPLDSALRETAEETGLAVDAARLRAVVSEIEEVTGERWLTFCFRVHLEDPESREGSFVPKSGPEGDVHWQRLADYPDLATPPADDALLAAIMDPRPGVAFLSVRMREGRLAAVEVNWA
jgi:8-oxo-dGTP diphosphatase